MIYLLNLGINISHAKFIKVFYLYMSNPIKNITRTHTYEHNMLHLQ